MPAGGTDEARGSGRASRLVYGPFPAVAAVFAALYMGYGTESPFLPAFFAGRGLTPSLIGYALAAGTVLRLVVTPAIGRIADRRGVVRGTLALFGALAGLFSFCYLLGDGFPAMLVLSLLSAFATAPLAPFADALALSASERGRAFDYGWVRAVGSGAFVVGTLLSGQLIGRFGLASVVVSSGVLFLILGAVTPLVPSPLCGLRPTASAAFGNFALLMNPLFARIVGVAALIVGSHALNDAFAVIQWRDAGLSPTTIGVLWSESVASEVLIFFLLGPILLRRFGTARCAALAAVAGVVRWGAMAETSDVVALAAIQLTHGLTFALLHLTNMRLIGETAPRDQAGSAQAIYSSGLGVASAILTAASGPLYAALGARSFWTAALLCGSALPFALRLKACGKDTAGAV